LPNILCDSDFLINIRFQDQRAIATLKKLRGSKFFASVISYYKVASGEIRARPPLKANQIIGEIFYGIRLLAVTEDEAKEAARRVRFLEKTQIENVSKGDVYIAATAVLGNYLLVTSNQKDFAALGVKRMLDWRNL
jgi:predicted nucleic acid-binding protein